MRRVLFEGAANLKCNVMLVEAEIDERLTCFHCGQSCEEALSHDDKSFCCYGCKTVYEILAANQLCEYYRIDQNPGVHITDATEETYGYLDEKNIRTRILDFDSEEFAKVTFYVPAIHCVSCIWLLENLGKMEQGVLHAEVNFTQKKVSIDFNPAQVQLSTIAALIASLGYVPRINLDAHEPAKPVADRTLALKIAVAGFCFGNVMLFSFPDYLGIDHSDKDLVRIFSYLNLALSVPVLLYSGWDYMRSAAKSFKQRQINIDVPIALGLLALFLRSSFDILSSTGPGYFDSFTGLVFFLLIGRWFQSKTYESLAFDRDFTAYFPLAVNRLTKGEWKPVVIYQLQREDTIMIRNMEIVPADSTLADECAYIDYSFVTGESRPVKINCGELIYAGGRLIGTPVMMVVEKQTSQSHLTSLWNSDAFRKPEESRFQRIIDRAAQRFTWVVLGIACVTAAYWQFTQPSEMWLVLTSVLMVACPCALALAAPFTFGSMQRAFGKHHLYLKNADVIERMASVNAVVFDKTGTITHGRLPKVSCIGDFSDDELAAIKTLTGYSTHPLSKIITQSIHKSITMAVSDFKELPGQGIEGSSHGRKYQIGSATFTGSERSEHVSGNSVFVSIDNIPRGVFTAAVSVRNSLSEMFRKLGRRYMALISGDHANEKAQMEKIFGHETQLLFHQSPFDKLQFIKKLQQEGKKVLMIGDGLNDAGALKQSDVGIAISDDSGVFTPASDAILYGDELRNLDRFLDLAKSSSFIVKAGFAISFLYNAIALSFAVTGHLTPLVAAILMPISSISVVGFTTLAVNFTANKKFKP